MAFDSGALTNNSIPQLFDGAPDPDNFGDPQSAYNHAVTNGWANKIRTGPLGRYGTNYENSYTFTNAETLVFIVPDYDLGDNGGGVSVIIRKITLSPPLNISPSIGQITLFWPTNFTGFTLTQSTNLVPSNWNPVGSLPMVIGTNNSVTLPLNRGATSFFRLYSP